MAKKPKPPPVPRELKLMVLARAEWCCDMCGRPLAGDWWSLQHRRARGAGGRRDGAHTPANLVALCGSATSRGCHSRVENERRAKAYALGFAIRGEVRKPEEVPIYRHLQSWVIPGDGVWVPAEPPADWEREAA